MRNFFCIALLFFGSLLQAQANWPFSVNNNAALEQAFLGSCSNPSVFGEDKVSAGLLYLNRTASATINAGGFGVNLNHKHTNIGLQAWQRGTENLNRQQYQLTLGKELSEQFSLGIAAGMQRINQSQNYGSLTQLTGGVFASLEPIERFSASAYWLGFAKNGTERSYEEAGLTATYLASKVAQISILMKTTPQWEPILGLSLSYTYKKNLIAQITVTDSQEPLLLNLMIAKEQWAPFIQYRQHSSLGAGFAVGVKWSK